jgi:hypothetical protein
MILAKKSDFQANVAKYKDTEMKIKMCQKLSVSTDPGVDAVSGMIDLFVHTV